MTPSGIRRSLSTEEGTALALFAIALFALVMITASVIDAANWFVHKRHLQLQADAAALAGGAAFQLPGCSDSQIYAAARQYAGARDNSYPGAYNPQVGGTPNANTHVLVNSSDYWPNDDGYPTQSSNGPCEKSYIDVKMTEKNLPWFFWNSLVPSINAHARVSLKVADTLSGQLPIGVPDVNPQSGAVVFYDEANPGNLSTTYVSYLRKVITANGLNEWRNSDDPSTGYDSNPIAVTMPGSGRLGVVFAFSSDGPPTRPRLSISGMTVSQICAQVRVNCYTDPSTNGLLFLHGEHAAPTDKTPVIQDATLDTTTCSDLHNAYFTYNATNCTATLRVNLGTQSALGNVQLTALPGGTCSGGGIMNGPTANLRDIDIVIPPNAGSCPITINWSVRRETDFPSAPGTTCPNNFPNNGTCTGSIPVVQRAFGGNDDLSGPVRTARVLNMGSTWTNAFGQTCGAPLGYGAACNSFPTSVTKTLAVDVFLAGAVSTSVNDQPVLLRIVGGSRNGSIDCNATGNLTNQIATGCQPPYTVNTDPNLACPATTKPSLFATPSPYPCVAIQTGGSIGQFTQGIQQRILNGSTQCPAAGQPGYNYWNQYPNFPTRDNPAYGFDDPRIIYVFMVPFGSFSGSGSGVIPIVSFGVFYVRGWGGNGSGNDDPCPGAIPAPAGDLVGNFITHVDTSGQSSGTQPCVIGSFNPCVAVLTK